MLTPDQQDALHYFIESDDWIYLVSPQRQRLCWIPVECRGVLVSHGKRVALGTQDGRVVILDFSSVITVSMSLYICRNRIQQRPSGRPAQHVA